MFNFGKFQVDYEAATSDSNEPFEKLIKNLMIWNGRQLMSSWFAQWLEWSLPEPEGLSSNPLDDIYNRLAYDM